MRTVRQFKDFVQGQAGVQSSGQFCALSEGHVDFWQKLNRLGWDKKTKEPSECDDIDATAPLTDQEWGELDAEFRRLQ